MTHRTGTWTHYRTCNLCEAMCGIAIDMQDEHILRIKGDPADPFSQGHICPKAVALQDLYHDPDRLRQPQRRTANGWQTIGWDEAFDEIASQLRRIQSAHGNNAVGIYLGNPNVHNLGSMLFGSSLIRAIRTQNLFTATSVDQLPHQFVARMMFGHQFLLPIPDVDRTAYFLILGANPLVSNGSLMTAGGIERRLKAIQQRGGKIVVVDPCRTETAAMADAHHFIRPASDALLLLAMVRTILAEGLDKPGRLADFTAGLDGLWPLVAEYTPEVVAAATGMDAVTITQLARDFATAPSAVCYGRIGLSIQRFGGLCQWLVNVLNLITGNLDRAGGAMFTTPAIDIVDRGRAGKFGRWRSRVRGLPEFSGELPVAALSEEITTPGTGQIKALVTVAGNPVLSTPNGQRLDQALASLEFMVAIDIYRNETTRHAHIILPPTTGLESEHYDLIFHTLAVRNSAKYSPALFETGAESRHDWQIFRSLVQRLSSEEHPYDANHPLNQTTPRQLLDQGLQMGPYGKKGNGNESNGKDGLSLATLEANPHGIDLGELQPRLPERLFTSDQRIQLIPDVVVQDLPRLREFLLAQSLSSQSLSGQTHTQVDTPLTLISRRQLRSNNSWMHNSQRLVRGKALCTLMMHSDDAQQRGLADGEVVTVKSSIASLVLPVEVNNSMMPGVVSIPHGWGHKREGVQLQVAQREPGVSVNDLTDEQMLDALTGNAALGGVAVWVSTAHTPQAV